MVCNLDTAYILQPPLSQSPSDMHMGPVLCTTLSKSQNLWIFCLVRGKWEYLTAYPLRPCCRVRDVVLRQPAFGQNVVFSFSFSDNDSGVLKIWIMEWIIVLRGSTTTSCAFSTYICSGNPGHRKKMDETWMQKPFLRYLHIWTCLMKLTVPLITQQQPCFPNGK